MLICIEHPHLLYSDFIKMLLRLFYKDFVTLKVGNCFFIKKENIAVEM